MQRPLGAERGPGLGVAGHGELRVLPPLGEGLRGHVLAPRAGAEDDGELGGELGLVGLVEVLGLERAPQPARLAPRRQEVPDEAGGAGDERLQVDHIVRSMDVDAGVDGGCACTDGFFT